VCITDRIDRVAKRAWHWVWCTPRLPGRGIPMPGPLIVAGLSLGCGCRTSRGLCACPARVRLPQRVPTGLRWAPVEGRLVGSSQDPMPLGGRGPRRVPPSAARAAQPFSLSLRRLPTQQSPQGADWHLGRYRTLLWMVRDSEFRCKSRHGCELE
jgi:hypothetical protein